MRAPAVVVVALALSTLSACGDDPPPPPPPAPAQAPVPPPKPAQVAFGAIPDVAERVVRSVVNVTPQRGPQGGGHPSLRRGPQGLGSGVLVSTDGVVVTNHHVVDGAHRATVGFHDGSERQAKVLGSDEHTDLAVLKIEGDVADLVPLPLGDSDALRLGETVLAVGNPFGVGQTVTMGIVSALGRARMGIVDYEDFIQTDAAINPGNSGGALVSLSGELVGINTAILSRSGGYQGIGFAIPSNMVRPVVDSLVKTGRVVRGWMGVGIQDLTPALVDAMKLSSKKGVLVSEVAPDGPAQKAGLQEGDVILSLDGRAMEDTQRLRNTVAAKGAGATVKVVVKREDDEKEVTLVLAEQPSALTPGGAAAAADDRHGLALADVDERARRSYRLPDALRGGALVVEVAPGSPAAEAGLREGDVVVSVGRAPVRDAEDARRFVDEARGPVLLRVLRGRSTFYAVLPPAR